jgi:hypothetical protein
VDTEDKRLALSKELDKFKLSKYFNMYVVIGLVRDMTDWSWIDGEQVNKSLFQVGRNVLREREDLLCLAFDASRSVNTSLMSAISCNTYCKDKSPFICEKKEGI